jgi:superfamily II DNA/RNA helicase
MLYSSAREFSELPISQVISLFLASFLDVPQATLKALATNKFTHMTDIQRAGIPHALAGVSILYCFDARMAFMNNRL